MIQSLRDWSNDLNPAHGYRGVESNACFTHHFDVPQSLAKILVHTVFSTKDRRPLLRDKLLRDELHRYLGGILTNLECQPIIVGGGTHPGSGLPTIYESGRIAANLIARKYGVEFVSKNTEV